MSKKIGDGFESEKVPTSEAVPGTDVPASQEVITQSLYETYEKKTSLSSPLVKLWLKAGSAISIVIAVVFVYLWFDNSVPQTEIITTQEFSIEQWLGGSSVEQAYLLIDSKEYPLLHLPYDDDKECLDKALAENRAISFVTVHSPAFWPFRTSSAGEGDVAVAGWFGESCNLDSSATLRLANDYDRVGPFILGVVFVFVFLGVLASVLALSLKKIKNKFFAKLILQMSLILTAWFWVLMPIVIMCIVLTPLTIVFSWF